MKSAEIVFECKLGHPLEVTPWVEASGKIHYVVQSECHQCDHSYIEEEAEGLAKQMVKDIRGGCEVDPVIDLLG